MSKDVASQAKPSPDLPVKVQFLESEVGDINSGAPRYRENVLLLPRLVVLTGRNGSGKTQFLAKLRRARIEIDGQDLDNNRPLIGVGELAVPLTIVAGETPTLSYRDWSEILEQLRLDIEHAVSGYGSDKWDENVRDYEAKFVARLGISRSQYDRMRRELGVHLHRAGASKVEEISPIVQEVSSPFSEEAFATMRMYRLRQLRNAAAESVERRFGGNTFLSETDFQRQYGLPLWDTLTDAMRQIGLPFEVRPPRHTTQRSGEFTIGQPSLVRVVNGQDVAITAPSTGESVLVRLTLALASEASAEVGATWPRLLLLDEPDAYLHPFAVRRLMDLIRGFLVGQLGITVVMTTHSATTVALSPPESVYLAAGPEDISPVDIQKAMNDLLQGVPTISVETADRRLIFVEDEADEDLHSIAFTALRDQVTGERSLTFLGLSSKNGKEGGSARVRKIVGDLRDNDQRRVWGIIDGDGKRKPLAPVFAATSRYSIENFALDPLTLGFYLGDRGEHGFEARRPNTREAWQQLVDLVATRGLNAAHRGRPVTVRYALGFELNVEHQFLHMQGHELEKLLIGKFSVLEKLSRESRVAGYVSVSVARDVWTRRPDLIDPALVELYQEILDAES